MSADFDFDNAFTGVIFAKSYYENRNCTLFGNGTTNALFNLELYHKKQLNCGIRKTVIFVFFKFISI